MSDMMSTGMSYSTGGSGEQGGQGELIKDTTTQNFAVDVIEESNKQPVLIDFWAPWCGPCKQLTPIIEKAVNDAGGAVKLVKMNIEEHPEISGQMGVKSIPAVVAFSNGRPVDGFMGAQGEKEIKEFIERIAGPVAPNNEELMVEEAEKLLEAEDFQGAAGYFSAALQADQTNLTAIAGLAKCAIGLGDAAQAADILKMTPEDKLEDPIIKGVSAQLALLEKAADMGDLEPLLAKIETDENDHQARFDLAIALNAVGKRQDAATSLLEIIARDREWNDDGARKELLTFFEAWGPTDDATKFARRKLSSILFS